MNDYIIGLEERCLSLIELRDLVNLCTEPQKTFRQNCGSVSSVEEPTENFTGSYKEEKVNEGRDREKSKFLVTKATLRSGSSNFLLKWSN